jgi:hypothetical protein
VLVYWLGLSAKSKLELFDLSLEAWTALYVLHTGLWLCVAKGVVPGWVAHPLAARWSAEGVRLFAWLWLIAGTAWFIAGIFEPAVRLAWPN